jgi:hypothetical protein
VVLDHVDGVKKCAKKIHDFVVELGGFDNILIQAEDIFFCFVRPVACAFRNKEILELAE